MDFILRRLVNFGKKRRANVPLALICIGLLYAVSVVGKKYTGGGYFKRLGKVLWGRPARRLAAALLSACLVFHLVPVTAFADEADASVGTSAGRICGHVHEEEECGYIEAVEGVSCSHQNEDGTYSCAPILDSGDDEVSSKATPGDADDTGYVCDHSDGCGYQEAVEGADCTHSCELCGNAAVKPTEEPTEKPTETPPEKDENFTGTCTCDTLCTEGIINIDCEVCNAEDADLSAVCEGREHEKTNCICDPVVTGDGVHTNPDCPLYAVPEITAYEQAAALFKALPSADSITEDTTDEERDILRAQIDAAIDALYALSDEDFAKFTAEYESLIAAVAALREAIEETVPNLLINGVVEVWSGESLKNTYSTLANAINAASDGDTLKILADIDLGTAQSAVTVSKSLTLDLNDKTITHKGMYGAIKLTGNADLTVTDSGNGDGKLEETSSNFFASAIYSESAGTITANGGTVTVTNAPAAGGAIYNKSGGSIVVDGGTVTATGDTGTAIYNASECSVVVKGGTVSASGNSSSSNFAIYSPNGGSIEVSGGTVSGDGVPAISNYSKPITITIKDGAVVTSTMVHTSMGTIYVNEVGSVLNVLGGTVENTADSGNVIYNREATVNISGGTVSASGSGMVVNSTSGSVVNISGGTVSAVNGCTIYNVSDDSAVNISGGIVSATNGCAIYNRGIGKIVISDDATVTSANSNTEFTDNTGIGTIFLKQVDGDIAKVLLEIQDTATVNNTANPEPYSVYFNDTRVDSDNLSQCYTAAETATVGRVYPEPPVITKPVPTVSSDNNIYANGVDIKIVAGNTAGNTNILYDKDDDGQIGSDEYLEITSLGAPGATGYDLSGYTVCGGSLDTNLDSDTKITMTGGLVKTIVGGGSGGTVKNASINIEGGKAAYVYGGGSGTNSDVTANTSVTISGGEFVDVYGGGTNSNVTGNTLVTIEGGIVTSRAFGGGNGGTVNGTATITISNGEAGAIVGGGFGGNVNGAATVTISGGTVQSNVFGGGMPDGAGTVGSGSSVTISGGAKIGNSDNPNNGIRINGGTNDISNGVDSFTIGGTLTGADGSILVSLPAGYAGGTIATEAVSGDLAKLKLVGKGAAGKEAYLDGTEIKVGEKRATPTVLGYSIHANGAEIKIVAGNTPDYTNILYDKDGDGQIGDTEYLKIGSTEPTAAGYDLKLYDVYGGSYNTAITANPKITMTGGNVTRIYGGGCSGVVTGDTSVTVSGGKAGYLFGGGTGPNSNVTGNTAVAISGGNVTSVYGGGAAKCNVSRDTSVTMSGGKVEYVYGGGSGSKVEGSTSVDLSGGEVSSVCGGGYMGTVTGTATVILRGGIVSYQVYGGSKLSEDVVEGGSTVTIGGGVNIGNPDNSDSGIVINGGTDSITNGVASFVIGNDLTGTAGSIFVSLPAGYTGGIIATEAVSGDLAKIKLAGDGAVGKEAYLDGTEIKVRQSGMDKTALAEAIKVADSAKSGITVSDNPASSVADGTKFVSTAEMKALTDAIAAAKIVMDNSFATAGEITAAVNALNQAVTTFKAAIKTGTDTGSGGDTPGGDTPGGGTSGGGSSSGNSSNSSSSNGGTKTPPATAKPGVFTESEIKMEGTVDASGNVTVTLPEQHVEDAIKKAEEEARKSGSPVKGITLVLNVNTGGSTAGSVTVNLPKVTQETIISKEIANTMIMVNNPEIKIGLDLSAVQEINRQANADVNITSTRQDNSRLTGNAKAVIGSRPVFDLKVNYGSGREVTHFGAGSVSIAIPYTLGAGEAAGGVYAVYVDGSGNVQWMDSSVYDAKNRLLRFNTSHFSVYGIGYKAPAVFTDTQGHWAEDDIQFVVARGLLNGASATTFDPNGAVTRGMFVTALGRLAGADVSSYATSSFTDVRADAYYMGYVEWAVKNGIVSGATATTFAPDDAVTRERMAVMMANYARTAGISLAKVHTENTFADSANISAGAREAVKTMQMAGVLAGRDGNRFDPQGTATRAQAAAALHRFIEVTIDVSTAQGWRQNDDGQWMYYENGSPVKNTAKQVGGEDYNFNAFGVTLDYPKKKTGTGTYTVQAGDSFWLIAKKHNVNMYMLAEVNGKTIHSVIHPGDVLRIPQ